MWSSELLLANNHQVINKCETNYLTVFEGSQTKPRSKKSLCHSLHPLQSILLPNRSPLRNMFDPSAFEGLEDICRDPWKDNSSSPPSKWRWIMTDYAEAAILWGCLYACLRTVQTLIGVTGFALPLSTVGFSCHGIGVSALFLYMGRGQRNNNSTSGGDSGNSIDVTTARAGAST